MKTYLLALLISIMTVYSPFYTIGVPTSGNTSVAVFKRWTWVRLFTELSYVVQFPLLFLYLTFDKVLGLPWNALSSILQLELCLVVGLALYLLLSTGTVHGR